MPIETRRLAALAGALTVLACSEGTDPSPEPEPVPNGRILWQSSHEHGSLSQLYSAEADGSGMVRLTSDPQLYAVFPAYGAPSAAFKISRLVDTGFDASYYTIEADGTGITGPFVFDFQGHAASPDGLRILGFQDFDTRIAIGDLRTGSTTYLATDSLIPFEVFWSPDGGRIGFSASTTPGPPFDLYTMRTDGTGLIRLTSEGDWNGDAAWSPDGERIAYMRSGAAVTTGLAVVDADGGNRRELYPGVCRVAWSPDSRQLVCTAPNGDTVTLIDVATADSHPTAIALYCQGWSPDGTRLLCSDRDSLYTVDPDGGSKVAIGPGLGFATWLRGGD